MWLCILAGHDDHWVTIGEYRVRVCQRCPHVTAVITWRQWPSPVNPEIGWATDSDPTSPW